MGDNQSSYSYPALERIWANAVRLTRALYPNLQDEIEGLEYLIDDINDELEYFGDMKYIGSYSAIVYKDDSKIYARDAEGGIIAVGEAGVDDRRIIQNAIDSLDFGKTLLLKRDTYTLDKKLTLKPINLVGEGIGRWAGTTLTLADNVNDDIIEMYSGGNESWKYYYIFGRIAHLRISGNKDNQSGGNGIVLAWTMHHKIEDVQIDNVYGYGIKILRSFWNHIEDCWITDCGHGIKLGEYDEYGKYNNSDPYHMITNQCYLENVHVQSCGYGIHIEDGDSNVLMNCDTSNNSVGVLLRGVSGCSRVHNTHLYSHWFESNDLGFRMTDTGSNSGTEYAFLFAPLFSLNTQDRDVGSSHYIEFNHEKIIGGTYDPIIEPYDISVKNCLKHKIGSYMTICSPTRFKQQSPDTINFNWPGILWTESGIGILTEWDEHYKRYIQATTPIPVSSNYDAKQGDIVLANASSASITVTLPNPANTRRHITVKKIDSSSNVVTINPYDTETIEGNTSYGLTSQYQYVTLTSDGNNWYIISD